MLERARVSDAVRVRCDLSPTGRTWTLATFAVVARLLASHWAHAGAGWLFTTDVLEVDELDMESAISVARGLVDLGPAGRFLRGGTTSAPLAPSSNLLIRHGVRDKR